MSILFRCDGSVQIGMGHVVRCLALAGELKKSFNSPITFAVRHSSLATNFINKFFPVIQSDEVNFKYVPWLLDCIMKHQIKILILDVRDGLTRADLSLLKRETGVRLVTIDDPEEKRIETDLAFYPPVPQLNNFTWDDFKGKLCIGWEYVFLREEFLQPNVKIRKKLPNVLISMGGTDEHNMTSFAIKALMNLDCPFVATIIIGSGYQHKDELVELLENVKFDFKLVQNPDNISAIMAQADLALISFGQTAYELATLRVPAIYICISEDHLLSAELFVKSGIGIIVGIFNEISEHQLRELFLTHLKSEDTLRNMAIQAAKLNISDYNKSLAYIGALLD
jgi:UDP-2,4-diacetamido-2,4,6-trideoxy-beta-L-altropyranose hydrolase